MTAKCFFCGEPNGGKLSKHHVRPRRFYKRGENHKKDNLAPSHSECHQEWHRKHDNPRLKWWQWEREVAPQKFGENVFAD